MSSSLLILNHWCWMQPTAKVVKAPAKKEESSSDEESDDDDDESDEEQAVNLDC